MRKLLFLFVAIVLSSLAYGSSGIKPTNYRIGFDFSRAGGLYLSQDRNVGGFICDESYGKVRSDIFISQPTICDVTHTNGAIHQSSTIYTYYQDIEQNLESISYCEDPYACPHKIQISFPNNSNGSSFGNNQHIWFGLAPGYGELRLLAIYSPYGTVESVAPTTSSSFRVTNYSSTPVQIVRTVDQGDFFCSTTKNIPNVNCSVTPGSSATVSLALSMTAGAIHEDFIISAVESANQNPDIGMHVSYQSYPEFTNEAGGVIMKDNKTAFLINPEDPGEVIVVGP